GEGPRRNHAHPGTPEHIPATQLDPDPTVAPERAQGARERPAERGPVVRREREAVPVARVLVDVAHGVREATDRAHDRDRPVAERDELTEPTRLEPRWHEEQIAARVDPLGERRVEAEREEEPRWIALAQLPPPLLVCGVAAPEHDELRAALEEIR